VYIEPMLSKPQILIVGRSLAAQFLCKLGKVIGYQVSVVAPRANRESFPDADLIINELDLSQVKITPETYVVVSTQGEHDEEALEQALRANTPYVSFIASMLKARKVFDFLTTKGLAPELLSRVKAPAGLNIGASSSQEIAVSILAEIVQARKSKVSAAGNEHVLESALAKAQDPVCGMAVDTSVATYVSEYRGKTFYFCCGGCQQAFDREPEVYAEGEQ
jgi:xanthine dehydrogenase accessory factor